ERRTAERERDTGPALSAHERREQRIHVRPALRGLGLEPANERGAHAARQRRRIERGAASRRLALERLDRVAAKRPLPGERLPQRNAKRELIRSRPDDAAAPLL